MTAAERHTPHSLLAELGLETAGVAQLPSKVRKSLVAHLVRWGYEVEARDCLQAILQAHDPQVSVYDDLARLYLKMGEARRAQEIMRLRHQLKRSNTSAALEARTHLAAGDLAAAQAIAQSLAEGAPDALLTWSLQVDVCLAGGDLRGAEAALARGEALQPESVAMAQGWARLWTERGDGEKALLWARTAVSRANRDDRQPSVDLLHLLEGLHRAVGQAAQADAIAAELQARRESEWQAVRLALGAAPYPVAAAIAEPRVPPQPAAEAIVVTAEEADRLREALRQHFGHAEFRPGQAETIAAVLRGESVLAVMPTGAGKSLCYQLAAMLLPGTTLVISPLIALMKDQLDGLPAGVVQRATALNSTLDGSELEARLAGVAAGRYRLVYAAPERLRQRPFLYALTRAGVSLLVVDEAHCVSLWGHDFRPDYRFIAQAWQELGRPRILGMTATATPRVQDDVQAALGEMRLVTTGTHRPNLHLEARRFASEEEKRDALVGLCRQHPGSGIVYATSREKCELLATLLHRQGVQAIHYHAGIDDRAAAQDRFMSGEARVVVATVAFGMGVDKSDVRFIVHYNPPRALENYYQEAGRAGRDGLPARCVLFHTKADWRHLVGWAHQDALDLDLLRRTYAAVRARLGPHPAGIVTAADLERDLGVDETRVRVAVHFLETAGLVWRGFDLPRTATLTLRKELGSAAGQDQDLARFVEAARLRPGQILARDLAGMAREAGQDPALAAILDPRHIEGQLLAWAEAGWLEYRGVGRDMLLALPPSPAGSRERVAAMVADYHAGQAARIAEMRAYAESRACRHGHISLYFGGQSFERCEACDNCRVPAAGPQPPARPAPPRAQASARAKGAASSRPPMAQTGDPIRLLLRGVEQLPYPMGRSGLARALHGAASSTLQADRFPLFGALASQSQKSIMALTDQLLAEGLLEQFKQNDYPLLRLTARGKTFLATPEREEEYEEPGTAGGEAAPQAAPAEGESELFERLRAWRLATAREMGKPPYVVCHDSTLRAIAAARPTSLAELAAVKGMGPRRIELYGEQILRLVTGDRGLSALEHRSNRPSCA